MILDYLLQIKESADKAEIKVKITAPKAKKATAARKDEPKQAMPLTTGPNKVVRGGGKRALSAGPVKGKKCKQIMFKSHLQFL